MIKVTSEHIVHIKFEIDVLLLPIKDTQGVCEYSST